MANLITVTGPFDGMKMDSTRVFNGDLVSGLDWTPEKATSTTMTFTDGTEWYFEANPTKTPSVLNTLVATIASTGSSKRLIFSPTVGLKNINTGAEKAIAKTA
jgi:hypothetical protein